jgi:deoxyribonucleoside regulator
MALPFDNIKQKQYRIGIAAGRNKIEPVYAALRGGIINVLVVDEDIAKAVIAGEDQI